MSGAEYPRLVLVAMGVSGVGKSTIAGALADRLGWEFQEGDALHPPENVAKMHDGIPLTDADRAPWLARVAEWIDARRASGAPGIITCSALKRGYRRRIIGDRADVRPLYLKADVQVIRARLRARTGHYMPASLLDSQLATLEEPGEDERPITVLVHGTPEEVVAHALAAIRDAGPGA